MFLNIIKYMIYFGVIKFVFDYQCYKFIYLLLLNIHYKKMGVESFIAFNILQIIYNYKNKFYINISNLLFANILFTLHIIKYIKLSKNNIIYFVIIDDVIEEIYNDIESNNIGNLIFIKLIFMAYIMNNEFNYISTIISIFNIFKLSFIFFRFFYGIFISN
jgi:hypothetical protein